MKKESSSSVAGRYLQILALLSSGGGDYDKGRKFSRAFLEERLAAQDLKVLLASIFWPATGAAADLVDCSDHRLVFVDLQIP